MLKSTGIIDVQPHKGRMVVDVGFDFVKLYNWFIMKQYWIKMNTPMHGAHITIASPVLHKLSKENWRKAIDQYHKKTVDFTYDEYIVEGGYKKGFIMYYLRVYSDELDAIKKELGIVDGNNYRGLHLTIGNLGKSGSVIQTSWPEMITIDKSDAKTK